MTQIGFTGEKISQELDTKTIRKGGCIIKNIPVVDCSLASEHETMTVQVGGYRSIINYNKHRERQHRSDKFNQTIRELNRNIKNKRLRQSGLTHNTGVIEDFNS